MELTRDNYERFFIDYLDGKLTGAGKEGLLEFLDRNPDLMEELKNLENMVLIPAAEVYTRKPVIRKTLITLMSQKGLSFDELCAASVEGDLQDNENGILLSYLKRDDTRKQEYELFRKTVLLADTAVIYPHKRMLKHSVFVQRVRMVYITISVAAAILLTLLLVVRPWEDQSDKILAGEQETALPDHRNTTEAEAAKVQTAIPLNKLTGNETGTSENFLSGHVPLPDYLEKEDIILSEIISRSADLLIDSDNHHDFTVQRYYTRSNASNEEYLKPAEFLTDLFKEKVLNQEHPDPDDKITFWELADAGIQGLANLSPGNIYIDRSYNPDGKMQRFTLETSVFGFSTPVSRRNNAE